MVSIKIMTAVWDEPTTKGSERLVLLALADNANDEGFCWPSLETIAKKCNITRRFAIKLLDSLEERGLIERERRTSKGMYTSTMYRVMVHKVVNDKTPLVVNPSSLPSEPQDTTGSELQFTRVVNPSSLKPSINHHIEPPVNPGKQASPERFTEVQGWLEELGLQLKPADVQAVHQMALMGVVRDDIQDSAAFYRSKGKVIRSASQMMNSVEYHISKRKQDAARTNPQEAIEQQYPKFKAGDR